MDDNEFFWEALGCVVGLMVFFLFLAALPWGIALAVKYSMWVWSVV
jgi:hypothetical protein